MWRPIGTLYLLAQNTVGYREVLLHKVCRLYPQASHYGADFTDQLLAAQALIKRGANTNATCTS
jgi:hypothetical protein